jgi:hypothetical protein
MYIETSKARFRRQRTGFETVGKANEKLSLL